MTPLADAERSSGDAVDGRPNRPTFPAASPPSGSDDAERVRELRRFHWRGEGGGLPDGEVYLPALLWAYRDAERLRGDYPLFVAPGRDGERRPTAVPLPSLWESVLGNDTGRVLQDNVLRLERHVRRLVPSEADAATVLREAGRAMLEQLHLSAADREAVVEDLDKVLARLPEGGRFLALDDAAALRLFAAVARSHAGPDRDAFAREVADLAQGLRALLDVESRKKGGEEKSGGLGAFADRFVNTKALSGVLGEHRGAEVMSEEREQRVRGALEALEDWQKIAEEPALVLVHDGSFSGDSAFERDGWHVVVGRDVCATAAQTFDQHASEVARVLRAVRTARLELAGNFDPLRHPAWISELDWRAFGREELALLPRIVAEAPAAQVARGEMPQLHGLMLSGRPVQVFVQVAASTDPAAGDGLPEGFRFEAGYLGLAFREALVQQGSPSCPDALLQGFERALRSARAGFHVLARPASGADARLDAWLVMNAAVEGRAHPLFLYDPEGGLGWARRLSFASNPSPESDWPSSELKVRREGALTDETLSIAFTFADVAALDPAYSDHFFLLDDGFAAGDLVGVDEYLDLDETAAAEKVPFVWLVGKDGRAHRAALSRRLALACGDRRSFWRTLQELAGIRSEYIEEAVARARREAEDEHRRELDRVREEAADDAAERILRSLLNPELAVSAAPAAAPSAGPPPGDAPATALSATALSNTALSNTVPAPPAAAAETEPPAAAEEDDDSDEPMEPYIDTELCTSCNDCINLNPLLFAYNGDKKAIIKDPGAGSYSQLVEAAEACPARVIHPGTPLNPDEPGMDEWIARAAPFNG